MADIGGWRESAACWREQALALRGDIADLSAVIDLLTAPRPAPELPGGDRVDVHTGEGGHPFP